MNCRGFSLEESNTLPCSAKRVYMNMDHIRGVRVSGSGLENGGKALSPSLSDVQQKTIFAFFQFTSFPLFREEVGPSWRFIGLICGNFGLWLIHPSPP